VVLYDVFEAEYWVIHRCGWMRSREARRVGVELLSSSKMLEDLFADIKGSWCVRSRGESLPGAAGFGKTGRRDLDSMGTSIYK